MKNVRKVLAMVLALTMVLGVLSINAFAYTDIPEDATYNEAVTILTALGVLEGDPSGEFRPEDTIKRSEFAKIVCEAAGLGAAANGAKGETAFTDVAADHWASGYINMATQQGIILGYGDGTFGPDDPILYEQAVKMVVATLGYTPKANANGGYPSGYLIVAAQNQLLENIANTTAGVAVPRSLVAQLVYNALDVELMEQTVYGDEPVYAPVAGSSLLKDKLRIDKVEGVVTANDYTNVGKKEKEATVTPETTSAVRAKINGTDIGDYLGYTVTAYAKTINNELNWVAVAPKTGKNVVRTIDQYIEGFEAGNGSSRDRFTYYENEDDDDISYLYLASGTALNVFYNGGNQVTFVAGDGSNFGQLKPEQGQVTLIDNNNDDVYDYVMYEEYKDYVVEQVSNTGRVSSKIGSSIEFDAEKSQSYDFHIYKGGEEITPQDLQEWDVLSVLLTHPTESQAKVKTAYVSNDIVEGSVTEVGSETDPYEIPYTIDGTEYYVSNDSFGLALQTEGTFYLNAFGKIAYFDGSTSSGTYGFLKNAGVSSGIAGTLQYEILKSDGTWEIFNSAANGNVRYIPYGQTASTTTNVSTSANAEAVINSFSADGTSGEVVPQIVSYKTNSSGEIREILRVTEYDYGNDENAGKQVSFREDIMSFGSASYADNTVIFAVASTQDAVAKRSDVTVADITSFIDREEYFVQAIYNDSTGDASVIVVYGAINNIGNNSPLFVVDSLRKTNDDDNGEGRRVVGYYVGQDDESEITINMDDITMEKLTVGGELDLDPQVVTAVDGDGKPTATRDMTIDDLEQGDIIQTNSTNNASRVRVIDPQWDAADFGFKGGKLNAGQTAESTDKSWVAAGYVLDTRNGKFTIGKLDASGNISENDSLTSPTKNVIFTLITETATGSYRIRSAGAADAESALFENNAAVYGSSALVRQYDEVTQEVIIFNSNK